MDLELFNAYYHKMDQFEFDLEIDNEYWVFDKTYLDFSDAPDDLAILD